MPDWQHNVNDLKDTLAALSVRDNTGKELDTDAALLRLVNYTLHLRENRKTLYLIGNGASASIASHASADLGKNARIHTEVFTDLSLITAIANDLNYEEVFAEPLRHRMVQGDMLVSVSSSGRSPNIIRATKEAVRIGGLAITLSAMDEVNPLRSLGALNFYLPAKEYGMAETCHAALLHYWIDMIIGVLSWQDRVQANGPDCKRISSEVWRVR